LSESVREVLETPVVESYDVVVVGGGVAGVGAALAAARAGMRCLLLEKSVLFGGLATLGLIAWYEPLCDGRGRKILGGLAEELLRLSIRYGYDSLPAAWQSGAATLPTSERYRTAFNPSSFVLALDELLSRDGVDVLLDALCVRPLMEGRRCRAVVVEEKGGRLAYGGEVFVDATGDAELFAKAGCRCVEGRNWLSYSAYLTTLELMRTAVEGDDLSLAIKGRLWGSSWQGKGHPAGMSPLGGLTAGEITRFVLEGRSQVLEEVRGWDARRSALLALPAMAQLRTVRRIHGLTTLGDGDRGRRFEDSIGCTGDFSEAGPVYEIPYRALLGAEADNLITAGRSISAEGHAWDVTRVIPPAVMTGQAAGTAAALAIKGRSTLAELPLHPLQESLAATGVLIHA
jgi:hypothetical protein